MTSPVPDTTPATIAPVEPVVAVPSEPERFERAGAISDRLVDNIETVVYGKREEIKLVLTALACDGHVLLEDVPGTAKTVLARAVRAPEVAQSGRGRCPDQSHGSRSTASPPRPPAAPSRQTCACRDR